MNNTVCSRLESWKGYKNRSKKESKIDDFSLTVRFVQIVDIFNCIPIFHPPRKSEQFHFRFKRAFSLNTDKNFVSTFTLQNAHSEQQSSESSFGTLM